jgi:hypothetical protein
MSTVYVGSEVLTPATIKNVIVWDVKQCNPTEVPEHGSGMYIRIIGGLLPGYTAQRSTKQHSSTYCGCRPVARQRPRNKETTARIQQQRNGVSVRSVP